MQVGVYRSVTIIILTSFCSKSRSALVAYTYLLVKISVPILGIELYPTRAKRLRTIERFNEKNDKRNFIVYY